MCTAIALGGFMALSTMMSQGLSIQGQNAQLGASAQAQTQAARLQTQADYDQLELRKAQEHKKITVEQYRRLRQGERERGMISAKVADSGTYGGSNLRDTIASSIAQDIEQGTLENNLGAFDAEVANQKNASYYRGLSVRNQAQSKVNSRMGQMPTVLSLIGAGLGGFSTGASTFNSIN